MAVDNPLEFVKRSLKVSPSGPRERFYLLIDDGDKSGGSKVSIASACFDRILELRDQGFEESDIRALTSTIYISEMSYYWRYSS